MREKTIERRLLDEVRKAGGICMKFTSPAFSGVPDRLILMPGGVMVFAELKAPGKTPGKLQRTVHGMLRDLGFRVEVIDSMERVKEVIDEIRTA